MFGFSIFLGSDLTEETEKYIIQMSENGFIGMFTSMHIPEDDSSKYLERITHLGDIAKKLNLNLMMDISTKGLTTLGLDIENDAKQVRNLGVTGLRMDYGISMETIAKASRDLTIGLNASTLSPEDVLELTKYNANFSNMEFWHNYYPRIETGLSKKSLIQKNKWLKELGGKIIAFTPGDEQLRGPLFDSLPTLEKHRLSHPLAASIELLTDCLVDEVYIGDEKIQEVTIEQFKTYQNENLILLNCQLISSEYHYLLTDVHTNRMDDAEDVVRSQEARFKELPTIQQMNSVNRSKGSITLDNLLYGRYMGELQITKKELPADSRVNVMGKVTDKDIPLIEWILAGQKYQLIGKD